MEYNARTLQYMKLKKYKKIENITYALKIYNS